MNGKQLVPIIITDIEDAPITFNLLCNLPRCARFIRYGYLLNEKTQKVIDMRDIMSDDKLRKQCEEDYQYLFTLKYKPDEISQEFIE